MLYKILVRPVFMYASETWTLSKTDERLPSLFERRVLRCIFGVVQENGMWRKRCNHELYELFNEPDIVKYIKVNKLEWAGQVTRMGSNRTVKKMFNTRPEGTRKIGRPKLGWKVGVTHDIKALGVKNWKSSALNREECLKFLKKARAI
jgi:hypothetical protein